jgi:hypothetical protein
VNSGATSVEDSVADLLSYNAALLAQHKQSRTFQLFSDGTLEDADKREIMLQCVQMFARHFQTMLFARQSHCEDPRFRALFLRHLREESGHEDVLSQQRGRDDELWDPIMESAAAWFTLRMSILDNIEKLAVMHLVLESSGSQMGGVCGPAMRRFARAQYFELHDEVADSHVTMAIEPLQRQPPETIERVRVVVGQAWQVLDLWIGRVATIVTGERF